MSPKEKRFCEEYIIDLNGTQAYQRAGYKVKNDNVASVLAVKLLGKVNIQEYVKQLNDKRSKKTEITAERVLIELGKIGFSDIKDYLSFNENGVKFKDSEEVDGTVINEVSSMKTTTTNGSGENATTTERVQFKLKLCDKLNALDKIGNHLTMWKSNNNGLSDNEIEKLRQLANTQIESNL